VLLIEKVILLKSLDFFTDAPEENLAELATACEVRDFAAGDPVWESGMVDRQFYVVVSGAVSVLKDRVQALSLGSGDMFGELSLLTESEQVTVGVAMSDTRVLLVPQVAFEQLVLDHAVTARQIMAVLARRLLRSPTAQRSARLQDDVLGGLQERLGPPPKTNAAVGTAA
jgi:CRP-like cAMP-binding protein